MALPKVTRERLEEAVKKDELKYQIDESDGEIGIGFNNLVVWLNLDEKSWRTYGIWRGNLVGDEIIQNAKFFANNLNSELMAPKTLVRGNGTDEEPAKFIFESTVPIEEGLTDEQIYAQFSTSMRAIIGAIEKIEENYPTLVTWDEEE